VDALKNTKASKEDRLQIMQVLRKFQEEEDHDVDGMYEELESMDLDDPDLFDKLPKHLQQDFARALREGQIDANVPIWDPWWLLDDQTLVQEITDTPQPKAIPWPSEELPPLSSMIKREPSIKLYNNLLDILYAYAYTWRLYNGDPTGDAVSTVSCILQLSKVLSDGIVYDAGFLAIEEAIASSRNPLVHTSLDFSLHVLTDILHILKCKSHLVGALWDIYRFMNYVQTTST